MEGIFWAKEGAELLACFFCLRKGGQVSILLLLEVGGILGAIPAAIRLV